MTRLYIFAEGQTEQTYGDIVLKKHLAAFGVYMQKPILVVSSRSRGRFHRGGVCSYSAMKNNILHLLRQEKDRDVFFTTMIDLYALPSDFPGTAEAEKLRHSPYDRVSMLEKHFAQDVADPFSSPSRFIPHIQLHEYEAILLCQPSAFSTFYDNCSKKIEHLQNIVNNYQSPELINDGATTAPSKRIVNVFPDYEGAKTAAGPQIAETIGLETIRKQCPHFNAWLNRLESLAS